MTGPDDLNEEVRSERITLDVIKGDSEFVARYAAYRNVLAEVRGERLRRLWTRKSLAENLFAAQCNATRKKLKAMFEAIGEFPDAKDEEAMKLYVKKMLAWDAKLAKQDEADEAK